jgi:copper transport protein
MKFRLSFIALILLASAILASPVFAHASLLKSNPEANASLPRPPVQIELFFSEALESSFSSITVLNSDGASVDSNDSRVDAADSTRMTVSLRSIPDGVYTVTWKALSAVDGHLTTGSFPFAVGNVDPSALAAADQASNRIKFSFDEMIARWLLFLSVTALSGGAIFNLVVWRNLESLIFNRLNRLALITLTLANIIGLISQAGQASNTGFALPWDTSFTGVLFTTRFGALWIARFGLSVLLVRFTLVKYRHWIVFAISLILLLTISLGSHAAADADPTLAIINDWIHLIAASVWVGGLIHFAAGLWSLKNVEGASKDAAQLIPRFSALALISVGTLILSGLYAAVLRVGSLEALNNTIYGRTLIVKLIIALPMLAMGAINLLVITPGMKKTQDLEGFKNLQGIFRKIVTSEVTMGAVLLLSVAVLTSLPPAQTASTLPSLAAQKNVDDLNIKVEIAPGRVGQNTFTVRVEAGGVPVTNAQEVRLQFTSASGKVPPSKVQLAHQGGGVYSIKGTYLSLPDAWQAQTMVRRENKFDAYANFDFAVGASATQTYPWNRVNGGLLLASALAYVFAFVELTRTRAQQIAFGLVPAFALAWVSATIFYNPPLASRALPVNPIPPNADSVAAGKELYEKNCVACHGATGKGDGAIGLTLNPRPADLSLHAAPGVHPDGQLYDWITNGFAGTTMPIFKQSLNDDQRWHLVNYIRTLAPK